MFTGVLTLMLIRKYGRDPDTNLKKDETLLNMESDLKFNNPCIDRQRKYERNQF